MKKKLQNLPMWLWCVLAMLFVIALSACLYFYLYAPRKYNDGKNDGIIASEQPSPRQEDEANSSSSQITNNFDNKGVELEESETDTQPTAIVLYEQGNNFYSQKKYEDAILYYDKAIQANPHFPVIFNKKAQVLYELGRKEEAFDTLKQGLENNPDDPQLLSTYEIINAK